MLGTLRKHALGEPIPEKKKRKRTEDGDQARVVAWLRERNQMVVRMEQGGERKPWVVAILKALGLEPGATDVVWIRPRGHTIWIEVKSLTGKLSADQIEHHRVLRAIGHVVVVGYGSADIIAQLETY